MPTSSFTLEQRVAAYASDVINDSLNLKAMRVLLETHLGRSFESTSTRPIPPQRKGAVLQTRLKEAVWETVPAFRADISPEVVLRKLERAGHVFVASDRRKAVSDALQKLCKAGKLTAIRKGRAGKSSVYRVVQ